MEEMNLPRATYRVQLHKEFDFSRLRGILTYLHDLGVSTIYASPITKALPGSMHGYDVADPQMINPEIGTRSELEDIAAWLKERGMDWLQDIVPNHMAFSPQNPWMRDVMMKGAQSEFAGYFDLIPAPGNEKMMVPFLGAALPECVRDGSIRLGMRGDRFVFAYGEEEYPVAPGTLPATHPEGAEALVEAVNQDRPGLETLLNVQPYRLCSWQETMDRINFRRFFAVNSLICLRAEDRRVFDASHALLLQLQESGLVAHFRIDHIDGLASPQGYATWLRQATAPGTLILAEKILQAKEVVPADWPLDGTSGYDFLAMLDGLLTDKEGFEKICRYYRGIVPSPDYPQRVYEKKLAFLRSHLRGEWDNLMRLLEDQFPELSPVKDLRETMGILMAAFPTYRAYPDGFPLKPTDEEMVETAFARAERQNATGAALQGLRDLFRASGDPLKDEKKIAFIRRWSQFTGPLAAKGTEDTVFYTYNPLISLNEVGNSPGEKPLDASGFHLAMMERQAASPRTMNASGTHDTKRGEDARTRISMITVFAGEWIRLFEIWQNLNRHLITGSGETRVPSVNNEYMFYQALIGSFPPGEDPDETYEQRFMDYLQKALREEKVRSNWETPDEKYEAGCRAFIKGLLGAGTVFSRSFLPFFRKIRGAAEEMALVLQAIRLTAPGIPDIYQGSELWDLSFVDPDNRRPVDYATRIKFLDEIRAAATDAEKLSALMDLHRREGIGKLYTTWHLLQFRKMHPKLFAEGEYIPVLATPQAIAYLRRLGTEKILIVAKLPSAETGPCMIDHPAIRGPWRNGMDGRTHEFGDTFQVADLFLKFPVACLVPD